ncbi:MAG: glycosyltransferase family 39 protein, partial [Acidimicrobiales bacterium]
MTTEIRSRTTINVALIIGLGALLRLVTLGSQSYSMDELWELSIVNLPVGDIVGIGDGFPPLFHVIFRGLLVGGVGDMAGRLLSAILGIVTIWVAWRMGKRISRPVGIGTAFAVAISPLLVLLSQEGRAYGLFILLASLLLLATSEALDDGSTRAWVFFGIVATLGLYSHYMFTLALASAEIVLLWNLARSSTWRRWIVTHAWMTVALIPLALIAIEDFKLDAANDYSRTVDLPAIGYAGLSLFTGLTLGPSASALHTMPT